MRRLAVFLPILAVFIFVLLPVPAEAANTSLVQIFPEECKCEGKAPDWGCVLETMRNLINTAIAFGAIVSVLIIAYAGALWMFSPFNPGNREKGRTLLLNAFIGLAIALGAWLIVDFVMKSLYNPEGTADNVELGPWNSILSGGNRCVEINTNAGNITSPDVPNIVTGGGLEPGGTPSEETATLAARITAFVSAAQSAGLTPRYEVANGTRKQELVDAGVSASAISVVSYISAEHFSVYGSGGCGGQVSSTLRSNPSCPTCAQINGPSCTNNCTIIPAMASALSSIPRGGNIGNWVVTEAFPPSTTAHNCTCHYNGTCVDANFR